MLRTLLSTCLLLLFGFLSAQMPNGSGGIQYGNEWIDYDQTYLRVAVSEDGIYRLSPAQLLAAGFAFGQVEAGGWKLEHQGEVVPLLVDDRGITFYGRKNRGGLDRFLFADPDRMQLNERYSMHSDTAVYYLSISSGGAVYKPSAIGAGEAMSQIVRESEVVFGEHHSKTFFRSLGSSIYYSHYDVAEGFGLRSSNDLLSDNGGTETTFTIPLPASTGGNARLDMRFGLAFDAHNQSIRVDGTSLTTITSTQWSVQQLSQSFTPSATTTEVSLSGSGSDRDKANVAWAKITYPALPNGAGLRTFIAPASAQKRTLTLSDLGADAGAVQLVGAENATLVRARNAGGNLAFDLPASDQPVHYHVVSDAVTRPAASISTLDFASSLPEGTRTNYLILTSARLNGPELEAMAAYRRSAAGGAYRVHVAEVEELYDEFSYGVARHPMALRNYLTALRERNPEMQYLFLVGKGREFDQLRTPEDLARAQATFFVPSFGFPASDNLLSAPVDEVVPTLSTGRLAAVNPNELNIYLTKLKDVENQVNLGTQTLKDRDWMKQVMHLGGGGVIAEQTSIKNRLNTLERTIESSDLGGNVTSFFKTSSEPIETSQQDDIFRRINAGTSIITFYGHSSTSGFDFSIDDPANYNNKGKYPYMLSLGCYSGDAFTEARSISEKFIFLQDKGAVAFAASKGVGYISALGTWGNSLYDLTGNELYGQGVGDVMRANIEGFSSTSNFTIRLLTEQFALSGDPAYRLHPRPGPDVVVDPASVRFDPEVIPAQDPGFDVTFRVVNLGKGGGQDSIDVQFRQQLPDGDIRPIATRRILTPNYDETLTFTLPNIGLEAVGQNRILIGLDAGFDLAEAPAPAAEDNNNLSVGGREGVPITFIANTAKTAFPNQYAVVGGPVTLFASTTDALAPSREYLLQVSTQRDFSTLVVDNRITSPGGVLRQPLDLAFTDSTTYYWRISPDSTFTEGAGYIWSESSFTWVDEDSPTRPYWAQQHPGQLVDGQFENILSDTLIEGWNFAQTATNIRVFNGIYKDREMPRFMRNAQRLASPFAWRIRSGLSLIVIDSINVKKWYRNPGDGEYNTRPIANSTWDFDTRSEAGRAGLIQFVREAIPEGAYVFLWSLQRGNELNYFNEGWTEDEENLGTTIFDVLEAEGALEIRSLLNAGSVPYGFAFRKNLGPLAEVTAQTVTDTILLESLVLSNWEEGTWTSAMAGPARTWASANVELSLANLGVGDSTIIEVWATGNSNFPARLQRFTHRFQENGKVEIDLSSIDAATYPELYLKVLFFDEEDRTVGTVKNVYFDYSGFGDVAINPQLRYESPDSVQQGEITTVAVGYENISGVDMDSLLVEMRIIDGQNQVVDRLQRQAPVAAGTAGSVAFEVPTAAISSNVRLEMFLNPDQDQTEKITFNNGLTTGFKVNRDVIDPILTVLFDGQRINDGALVSGRPEIRIQLRDDNQFLRLNDTSAYQLRLRHPDGTRETLSFSDNRIEFLPATQAENQAEIFFRPELLQDGTYELEVNGKDRSDNASGRLEFRRSFEVINEMRIGNVLTYPNPFTTQTRFVYTLTGNELPSMFRIQIMTVSGRVVRDIDLLQTETLSIGTHQTNFAWDGTDEFGDLLANGVYLYRVITSDQSGSTLEKQDTNTDQFFQNGLGKVVILR